ncbi:MAG: META domain-containing protein [Rhodobacteraceae bacterium]|nr:MAG: META domain-containing protein [Paracoccaceae bacterium]
MRRPHPQHLRGRRGDPGAGHRAAAAGDRVRLAAAAAALAAVAGCAVEPGAPTAAPEAASSLDGTRWTLRSFGPSSEPLSAVLRIEGDRARGAGPCNTFRGGFEQTGEAVAIGPLLATRRACPELDAEERFFGALTDAARYALVEGRLTLIGEDWAVLAVFDPEA